MLIKQNPKPSLERVSGEGEGWDLHLPRLSLRSKKLPLKARPCCLWFALNSSEVQIHSKWTYPWQEARERGGCFAHTAWGKASGSLSLSSPSGSCNPSVPGPSLPTLPVLAKGPPSPRRSGGSSNHYLGQVFLKGLQGQDHGGSYSPVIMSAETDGVSGPWSKGQPSGPVPVPTAC